MSKNKIKESVFPFVLQLSVSFRRNIHSNNSMLQSNSKIIIRIHFKLVYYFILRDKRFLHSIYPKHLFGMCFTNNQCDIWYIKIVCRFHFWKCNDVWYPKNLYVIYMQNILAFHNPNIYIVYIAKNSDWLYFTLNFYTNVDHSNSCKTLANQNHSIKV